MNPVNTEIEELKAIVEKMTPGPYYAFNADGDGSVCSQHGPCDPDCPAEPHCHKCVASYVEESNRIGIAALKNKAIPLIEALVKEKEDAEAVAWALSHGWFVFPPLEVGVWCDAYWKDKSTQQEYSIDWDGSGIPPVPDEVRAAIAKARGKS